MRYQPTLQNPRLAAASRPRARLWRDEAGASAVEFGLIGLPFLLFVLAILGYGLYFLTNTFLQYGVDSASRVIRTGSYNTGGKDGKPMTVGEFRTLACNYAKPVIDCSKMNIMVQHATDWTGISPQSCTDSKGAMTGSTGATGDALSKYAGEQSEVVLLTACYEWTLASSFPFLKLGKGADGAGNAILQAGTAFKSEPYAK